jgi:hypothetical protein
MLIKSPGSIFTSGMRTVSLLLWLNGLSTHLARTQGNDVLDEVRHEPILVEFNDTDVLRVAVGEECCQ